MEGGKKLVPVIAGILLCVYPYFVEGCGSVS
jgi:hypothetical protein